MSEQKCKPGDVTRLKSGGPRMTAVDYGKYAHPRCAERHSKLLRRLEAPDLNRGWRFCGRLKDLLPDRSIGPCDLCHDLCRLSAPSTRSMKPTRRVAR
jgi:uncharacterized protein DUF2158